MTDLYISGQEKAECAKKYPFLGFLMGEEITRIQVIDCEKLPDLKDGYEHMCSDWYFYHNYDFEDDDHYYKLNDVLFEIDKDDDKPITVRDHDLTLYKRLKTPEEKNRVKYFGPEKKRLVVVSGPSGVGKGPIIDWVKKLYFSKNNEELRFCQVNVRKEKTERHRGDEKELGFDGIGKNIYEFECRGTKQIIDLDELDNAVVSHDTTLIETYYNAFDFLKEHYERNAKFVSVFISPLTRSELMYLEYVNVPLSEYLPDVMFDSLKKRAQNDGKELTDIVIKELTERSQDSFNEMLFAHNYDFIIPNHFYESDMRWKLSLLIGEQMITVDDLYDIIKRGKESRVEKAEDYFRGLVPLLQTPAKQHQFSKTNIK